jgi:hypothetical protein
MVIVYTDLVEFYKDRMQLVVLSEEALGDHS